MTRAELEQVRALIAKHDRWHGEIGDVIFPDAPDVTVDLTDAYGDSTLYSETCEALAILDAELARPEAREWRLTYETNAGKCADGPWDSEAAALKVKDLLATLPKIFSNIAISVRVKGTPAGPWERAE